MSSISFIIPVYNKSRYLKLVLEAIYSQKGDYLKEYIFIDDGSSDDSLSLIKQYSAHWNNVTILSQENQGPSIAINKAISKASGEFIKIIDGDDVLLPEAADLLLDNAITHECDVVFGMRSNYYDLNQELQKNYPYQDIKTVIITDPLKEVLRGKIAGISSYIGTIGLIRKKLLDSFPDQSYADPRIFVQDFSLVLKCALRGKIGFVNKEVALLAPKTFSQDHLSSNLNQEAHDALLALYYFTVENKDKLDLYRPFIYRRATKIVYRTIKKSLFGYFYSKLSSPSMEQLICYLKKSVILMDNGKVRHSK